jgi:hypothetical protein
MWGAAVVMPAAPCFYVERSKKFSWALYATASRAKKKRRAERAVKEIVFAIAFDYDAAARGARLRELRWKNSAWLATAETIAGWNGFEIKNAGSGRSPVRKRSG